ncbi:MAG TPA: OmpW family outer membrane protein [Bordetella sp.]
MRTLAHLLVVFALFCINSVAYAESGDILLRVRAIDMLPQVRTTGTLSTLNVGLDRKFLPEIDLSYMFTNHIGTELVLGTTRSSVTSLIGGLGEQSLLPPTLTLQYHFNPEGRFRPYAGAGMNYTRFYAGSLSSHGYPISMTRDSFGPVLQLGMDIGITKNLFFNIDVKKIWMKTNLSLNGIPRVGSMPLGTMHIDPIFVGVGIGYRF